MNIQKGIITFSIGYFIIYIITKHREILRQIPILKMFIKPKYQPSISPSPSSSKTISHKEDTADMYLVVILYSIIFMVF
jgi:hypothetical protein